MVNMAPRFLERHHQYYQKERGEQNQGRITTPGSQYLVQLLKGGCLGEDLRHGSGKKALDVGCGSGFNCVSLAMMGWETFGCEISEDIVEHARKNIAKHGVRATVLVGENERIPFPDETFDLLLSMNVIHYVDTGDGIRRTVSEYARTLKKGGRILLTTTHPENWILKGRKQLDQNRVQVRFSGDYRDGETLFVFNSQKELQDTFSPCFTHIRTGENQLEFFTRTVRNFVLTAKKK